MGVLTIQFFLEAASCTHHGSALYKTTGVFGWIVSALAFYIGASVLFQEMYNKVGGASMSCCIGVIESGRVCKDRA